jgi:type IV pilus assembly protein PilW
MKKIQMQIKPLNPISQQGFSLIELMIAITLGALVVGATIGIFSTNRQTYIAAENVGRIQENTRTAFEIMTRDIREASGNACDKDVVISNILNGSGSNWWTNWNNPVLGFEDAVGVAGAAANTDAIQIVSGSPSTFSVTSHTPASSLITLNAAHDLVAGDVAIICDQNRATIFQVSSVGATTVNHAAGGTPGNCRSGLGQSACGSLTGTDYTYRTDITTPSAERNTQISRVNAARWYVGDHGRPNGGRSLFRSVLRNGAAVPEEVAEGVQNMQIEYLSGPASNYVNGSAVTNWSLVTAVRITFTIEGTDSIGTNGQRISRTVSHTVAIRNRNS